MISKQMKRNIMLFIGAFLYLCVEVAFATSGAETGGGGIGKVASNVTGNLADIAKLITAGSYVAGFGFAVGAIVKFKAHKDTPQQIPLGQPIAFLFVGAALIFIPSVFKTTGTTLFGSGTAGKVSGITSFM
ncbi:MAG TPA: type IV secretion protein IcmD [Gammaproteobacteria bacterium]|nr:type IV secretion protein IcmD [Gammaproteobacteria bacterium]